MMFDTIRFLSTVCVVCLHIHLYAFSAYAKNDIGHQIRLIRQLRAEKKYTQAQNILQGLSFQGPWADVVRIEQARLKIDEGLYQESIPFLEPYVLNNSVVLQNVVLPFSQALSVAEPIRLIQHMGFLEQHLPQNNPDARSLFLGYVAHAFHGIGNEEQKKATLLQQFIEEPDSLHTPQQPPYSLKPEQWISRAFHLQKRHHYTDILDIPENVVQDVLLTPEQKCQKYMVWGAAERSVKKYRVAMSFFDDALKECLDPEVIKKAWYAKIKNAFMESDAHAVVYAEEFVKKYPQDTMVDDVLFWSGDFYQGKKDFIKAESFFNRAKQVKNDYCEESDWRIVWMRIAQKRWEEAAFALQKTIASAGECEFSETAQARAWFWMGKIKEFQQLDGKTFFKKVIEQYPSDYYAYRARKIIFGEHWYNEKFKKTPAYEKNQFITSKECKKVFLKHGPLCEKAVFLYEQNFQEDAQNWVLSMLPFVEKEDTKQLFGWINLASYVGLHHEAHKKAEFFARDTKHSDEIRFSAEKMAYPSVYSEDVAYAEKTYALPMYALSGLIREESAFDAMAKSWAGAYGLTQLLPSTARTAAQHAKIPFQRNTDLFHPRTSLVLGAATLSSFLKMFEGEIEIALAGYNAGPQAAKRWYQTYQQTKDTDLFVESISFKETRLYVKRVCASIEKYRLLYGHRQ